MLLSWPYCNTCGVQYTRNAFPSGVFESDSQTSLSDVDDPLVEGGTWIGKAHDSNELQCWLHRCGASCCSVAACSCCVSKVLVSFRASLKYAVASLKRFWLIQSTPALFKATSWSPLGENSILSFCFFSEKWSFQFLLCGTLQRVLWFCGKLITTFTDEFFWLPATIRVTSYCANTEMRLLNERARRKREQSQLLRVYRNWDQSTFIPQTMMSCVKWTRLNGWGYWETRF